MDRSYTFQRQNSKGLLGLFRRAFRVARCPAGHTNISASLLQPNLSWSFLKPCIQI